MKILRSIRNFIKAFIKGGDGKQKAGSQPSSASVDIEVEKNRAC